MLFPSAVDPNKLNNVLGECHNSIIFTGLRDGMELLIFFLDKYWFVFFPNQPAGIFFKDVQIDLAGKTKCFDR